MIRQVVKKTAEEEPKKIKIMKRPKICLIDIDDDIKKKLEYKGLNITCGTFGTPIYVRDPNEIIAPPRKCIPNYKFPQNIYGCDIVILNWNYNIIPYNENDHMIKYNRDLTETFFISEYPQTVFDIRSYSSSILKLQFSRSPNHKRILIIFSESRINMNYTIIETNNHGVYNRNNIHVDNYSFSDGIPYSHDKYGEGDELSVVKGNNFSGIFSEILNKHIKDAKYNIIFDHPKISYQIGILRGTEMFDIQFYPLILNSDGEVVSFIRFFNESILITLPQIKDKGSFLEELLTYQLPLKFPEMFPFNSEFGWIKDYDYMLPNEAKLYRKKDSIVKRHGEEILQMNKEIDDNHREYEYLHNLLTQTGGDLVKTVKRFLEWLGFRNVKIMDDINRTPKEEDIQIDIDEGLIVVEIKGIGGTSTDDDCRQIGKIKHRRQEEREKFDVHGVYIVNHQMFLPPLKRINPPFNEQQIKDAKNEKRGMLTTWQLFNLYYSIKDLFISKEDAKKAFLKHGLIEFIPSNYVSLGNAKEICYEGSVIILDINANIKLDDALIIKREYKYMRSRILEMQDQGKKVKCASSGEIGFKLDNQAKLTDELFLDTRETGEIFEML